MKPVSARCTPSASFLTSSPIFAWTVPRMPPPSSPKFCAAGLPASRQPILKRILNLKSRSPEGGSMRSDCFRRTSFAALALLLAFAIVAGLSAYAADKKAAPGSVFAADKGKFNILLDGASIGREEFEVEPSGANWIAKGSTSLKTPDGKSAKVSGTLTLQPDGAPVSYDWPPKTNIHNAPHFVSPTGPRKPTRQSGGAGIYPKKSPFGAPPRAF